MNVQTVKKQEHWGCDTNHNIAPNGLRIKLVAG